MARLVLVEFDNDQLAEVFIAKLDKAANPNYRIVGLFAKPVQWCACPRPLGYDKGEVVMGARFGWWVHKICRRPRMGTHQPHNLLQPRLKEGSKWTTVIASLTLFEAPTKNLKAAREVSVEETTV